MDRTHRLGHVRHRRAVAVIAGHGHVHCRVHAGQIVRLMMVVVVVMVLLDLLMMMMLDRTRIAADVRRSVLRRDAFAVYAKKKKGKNC